MLLSQTVELKWNSKICQHYIERGYEYTKMGDPFIVKVEDLTKGSNAKVLMECDYCHRVYTKKWHRYLAEHTDTDACTKCKHLKAKNTFLERYGVSRISDIEGVSERRAATNITKYGHENPFASPDIKKKIAETNIKKYGSYTAARDPEVRRKARETSMARYGVEHYSQRYPLRGPDSPQWKGGVAYHRDARATFEYRDWRRAVFCKDLYTCQKCGYKNGVGVGFVVELNAHHISNWRDYPELRYEVSNGITLCEKCHNKFHNIYGKRYNNPEQMQEFLSSCDEKIC